MTAAPVRLIAAGTDTMAPRATAIIGPTSFRRQIGEELQPALAG